MSALDRLPRLGPRARKLVVVLGFVVLALVSFVMALQLTFPYDRVKDKLVEALAKDYEVTVGAVERGLMPGKMTLRSVTLRSRPKAADEVPTVMFVDRVSVDVGILALVGGVASIDLEADLGKGTIEGTIDLAQGGTTISLRGAGVAADAVPPIRDAAGLPLFGRLDLAVDLELGSDLRKARGAIQLACTRGCAVGDGKTKLKPKVASERNALMVGDGIDFGTVNIDRWLLRIELAGGKADLTRWEFASPDGELSLDLHLRLAKTLAESEVTAGCLKFKGTEALAKREPKTAAALTTTGGVMDTAGLFNIKLEGTFKTLKKRARLCDQPGTAGPGDGDVVAKPGRPALGKAAPDDGTPKPSDAVFAKPEPTTGGAPPDAAPPPPPPADAAPVDGPTGPPRPFGARRGEGPPGTDVAAPPGEPEGGPPPPEPPTEVVPPTEPAPEVDPEPVAPVIE